MQTEFAAAHALTIAGKREPVHGHNWRVTITARGPVLDADGLLCDFHALERALREAVARFRNADLNAEPPFAAGVNPSAENVAKHVAERVAPALPRGVWVACVRVTEAPGCEAAYEPDAPTAAPRPTGRTR